jgi:hypothetical protein
MDDIYMLGFDAREMWLPDWASDRRKLFLFRPDVKKPLSVDTDVWPSVFNSYQELFPAYTGLDVIMWEELSSLEECLTKLKVRFGRFYIAAFALVRQTLTKDEITALSGFLGFVGAKNPSRVARTNRQPPSIATPSVADPKWLLLGYDVASLGPISALSNCGFTPDTTVMEVVKTQWGSQLNTFHLFNEYSQANEFKNYSNGRVPEHAPFFVYGIWLIREVLSSEKET